MNRFQNYEDKVIRCHTAAESQTLLQALEEDGYEYAIPICPLSEFVDEEFVRENGEECCWRICETRGIAFNPDIKHYIDLGYEVIDYQDINL